MWHRQRQRIDKVDEDWRGFVQQQKGEEISSIITEEKLKPEETSKLMDNSFRDGVLKTTSTNIDRSMPSVSRFGGGG